jgi:NCAIR mutase (PurE)-related protein
MNSNELKELLEGVKNGSVEIDHAFKEIKSLPYEDLGYAKLDHHRSIRNGYPEVVYCEGKTNKQIVGIIERLMLKNNNILATRASREVYDAISEITCDAEYHIDARVVVVKRQKIVVSEKQITVITAGTADIPVAEEAAITAEVLGNKVTRIYDVGVAGIHRLLSKMDIIAEANVIIVVAGMEGALASVVGGLVDKPVIAVPTSVGYGANFGGLAALLTMLNSCSSGIGVVNIDNGFGAAYLASNINKL